MGRAKSKAPTVVVEGRTYHPTFPPSEQNDVELLTKYRFGNMTPAQAGNVAITKEEMLNFIKVYPRLYQVGKKTRDRLAAWANKHRDEIAGWGIDAFFKTKEEDERDDTIPRNPGPPPEEGENSTQQRARPAAGKQARGQKRGGRVSRDDGSDDGSDEHPENRRESPTLSAEPASEGGVQQAAENDNSPASELKAALALIKKAAALAKQLSDGADELDHYKKPLSVVWEDLSGAMTLVKKVEQVLVNQEKGAEDSTAAKPTRRSERNLKRGRQPSAEGAEDGESEVEKHIKSKRAQTVAKLDENQGEEVQERVLRRRK